MASGDERLRLVRKKNEGVAVARNTGFGACSPSARFVHFLDADDVLLPHALRVLRTRLLEEPELVAAVGACSRIDAASRPTRPAELPFVAHAVSEKGVHRVTGPNRLDYWHVLPITPISTPGQCLVRRSAMPTSEPFDPAIVPCEDWDLWLKLTRHGEIGVVPIEVLLYRDLVTSASKRYELMQRRRESVYVKQVAFVGADEIDRLRVSWRYGMFGFDARLSLCWAKQHFADRDFAGSARYALRSARYAARNLSAVARRQPKL
jgi:hypothetical protein